MVEKSGNFVSEQAEDLTLLQSTNGNLSFRLEAPLVERYGYATEPFREFRKGLKVESYNDSTHTLEATLTANYAIYMEVQDLWEAKGNVVAINAKGEKLETEQLFWDAKAGKIYSKVDTKVTQGDNVIYGDGFESDQTFTEYVIFNPRGKVFVTVEKNDSTAVAQPVPLTSSMKPDEEADNTAPVIKEGEAVAKPTRNN